MKPTYNAKRYSQYNPFYGKSLIHRENRRCGSFISRHIGYRLVRDERKEFSDGDIVPDRPNGFGQRRGVRFRHRGAVSGNRVREPARRRRVEERRFGFGRKEGFRNRRLGTSGRHGNDRRGFFGGNRFRRRERSAPRREFLDIRNEIRRFEYRNESRILRNLGAHTQAPLRRGILLHQHFRPLGGRSRHFAPHEENFFPNDRGSRRFHGKRCRNPGRGRRLPG